MASTTNEFVPHPAAHGTAGAERALAQAQPLPFRHYLSLTACPDCRARPDAGLLVNAQGRARGGVTRRHSAGVIDVEIYGIS